MNSAVKILYPLAVVIALVLLPLVTLAVPASQIVFMVILPYLAAAAFIFGFIYRIVRWANAPVPFNIPTTCGQERSLPWIKDNSLESPRNYWSVAGRMVLEIFFFRSLFRNSSAELAGPQKLVYGGSRWLWLGGLAFHWSLLVILFRHLRFFTEPVFPPVLFISDIDGVLQLALPALFITDFVILIALTYLFFRRVVFAQIKYISLAADYLALLLLLGVIISGVLMRSVFKVDLVAVKELAVSMISFSPSVPASIGLPFYIHLFLACILTGYFPFSKMMHAPGILLSPTRNLKNDSRVSRRVNPWSHPVRVHTYAEYENEFREPMKKAGLPLEIDKAAAE